MASNGAKKHAKRKGRHRLPPEQQIEMDKEGRLHRLVCDIVKLRIFKYILKQPPSFLFVVSLFLIAIILPLLGLFIAKTRALPDLDAMQNWNAYIGKLGQKDYCFSFNQTLTKWSSVNVAYTNPNRNGHNETVGVSLNFTVNQTAVPADSHGVLYGSFSGKDVKTQIKDRPGGERIDKEIKLEIIINTTMLQDPTACDNSSICTVEGCLLITALNTSVPAKLPQVHKNYTFADKVIESQRMPVICSIPANFSSLEDATTVSQFKLSSKSCNHDVDVVRSTRSISNGHGLIYIPLSDADRKVASYHMYLAALAVAALGITFALGISLTDRPADPKASQE